MCEKHDENREKRKKKPVYDRELRRGKDTHRDEVSVRVEIKDKKGEKKMSRNIWDLDEVKMRTGQR